MVFSFRFGFNGSRWCAQIFELNGCMNAVEFLHAAANELDREAFGLLAPEYFFGALVGETLDHAMP
jgi:hypothetical protein